VKTEEKNTGTIVFRFRQVLLYFPELLLELEMFQTKFVEKTKTHFMFKKSFPRKSCHLLNNVEKYSSFRQTTDDNIIRIMRFACWINKTTNTHSEYVILTSFSTATWLCEFTWMLGYTCIDCLVTVENSRIKCLSFVLMTTCT